MANIKISELNSLTEKDYTDVLPIVDTSANETKKISIEELINNNVSLLAVSSTAPSECIVGDKYYNTEDNRIYTATGTDTWSESGEEPIEGIFYIVFDKQSTYAYDGETLVSVGGGAGGGGSVEIGTIVPFAGSTAPDSFLMCNGDAISRTTYSALFNVIGTTYGAGDGSTTFNLPNLNGRVPVGLDGTQTEFDTLGETGGSKKLQQHSHTMNVAVNGTIGGDGNKVIVWNSTGTTYDGASGAINNAGTGDSGNLQPYLVVNYIIKASQTTPVQAEIVNAYSTSTEDGYSADYVNKAIEPNIISVNIPEVSPSLTEWTNYNITTGYTTTTKIGNKLTNNNGIKIGAGVNYVKVNITERIYNGYSDAIVYSATLSKNGNQINYTYDTVYNNGFATLSITSWLIPVQENDVITAGIIAGTNNTVTTIRGGILTVEVVN